MARDDPGSAAGTEAGQTAQVSTFPDPPTEPAGLTPRQRKVLEVIRDWVERFGYPPSVREIGDAVGLTSTSSVHHQLRTLERKGYLRRDPHRTRAVDVRGPDDAVADVPDVPYSSTSTCRAVGAHTVIVGTPPDHDTPRFRCDALAA